MIDIRLLVLVVGLLYILHFRDQWLNCMSYLLQHNKLSYGIPTCMFVRCLGSGVQVHLTVWFGLGYLLRLQSRFRAGLQSLKETEDLLLMQLTHMAVCMKLRLHPVCQGCWGHDFSQNLQLERQT